jgi:hypothetical protein
MAKPVEHRPREAAEALVPSVAERGQQGHRLAYRLGQPRQALGQDRIQLGQREAVERAAAQIEDGLHRGDHLVPARFGEQ